MGSGISSCRLYDTRTHLKEVEELGVRLFEPLEVHRVDVGLLVVAAVTVVLAVTAVI